MKNPYNPYDFVPFADTVVRQPLSEWQQPPLYSGYLHCTLKPVSPLCIKTIFRATKCDAHIPGTTIKGMLRQLISTLASGCGEFIERDYAYLRDKLYYPGIDNYTIEYFVTHGHFPDTDYDTSSFRSCAQIADESQQKQPDLCRTCYLYGYTGEKHALAGRIRVADSDRHQVTLEKINVLRLDQPRVYRWSFYFQNPLRDTNERITPQPPQKPPNRHISKYPVELPPEHRGAHKKFKTPRSHKIVHLQGGKYRGRKFYRHSQDGRVNKVEENAQARRLETPTQKIYVLNPENEMTFTFDVHFDRLSGDDLGLLIFALTLQKNLPGEKQAVDHVRHKLGYGKPLGMGSVEIAAEKLILQQLAPYNEFTEPILRDATHELYIFRNTYLENSGVLQSAPYRKLAEIWHWPGQPIAYPDLRDFFGNKDNRTVSLKDYNAGNWPPPRNEMATPESTVPAFEEAVPVRSKPTGKPITLELEIDPTTGNPFVMVDDVRLFLKNLYLPVGHTRKVKVKVEYDAQGRPVKAIFKGWVK